MPRTKIAVIFGGCSTEYEISLQSAAAVIRSIDKQKYDLIQLGITRSGEWYRYYGPACMIDDDTWMQCGKCAKAMISPSREVHGIVEFADERILYERLDAAMPMLHGKNGEDGTIQGLLELAGIPIIGCNTLCSAVCMDKDVAHRLIKQEGIAVARGFTVNKATETSIILAAAEEIGYPLFVKPARAGSSIGIAKVAEKSGLAQAITDALLHDNKVLIEEMITGFEVGCAILGNDVLTIGEVDEIELSTGFFDYAEKYMRKSSKIHMPARLSPTKAERIKDTAARIYRALGCSGFARVDLFFTPRGEIVFNEVNTIPGFTSHSRYPSMINGAGLSFEQVVESLIELAVKA
ncbi:MAG: D-alanine--D-serine ligase VanG [Clostridia bacterium]